MLESQVSKRERFSRGFPLTSKIALAGAACPFRDTQTRAIRATSSHGVPRLERKRERERERVRGWRKTAFRHAGCVARPSFPPLNYLTALLVQRNRKEE